MNRIKWVLVFMVSLHRIHVCFIHFYFIPSHIGFFVDKCMFLLINTYMSFVMWFLSYFFYNSSIIHCEISRHTEYYLVKMNLKKEYFKMHGNDTSVYFSPQIISINSVYTRWYHGWLSFFEVKMNTTRFFLHRTQIMRAKKWNRIE